MRNTAINFKDIGSGVSFVFPILTAVENTFLTIVEQPELHLHPRAQCEIGDVFIYAINHNRKMVVESHSEHILLRISRRIRENSRGALIAKDLKLRPDQVIIHYFKPNGDGTTTIFPIRFDQQGDFLDLWPDGFFAERDSEIFDE
jgi:predicted ATPase